MSARYLRMAIATTLALLLAHCVRPTWEEVAAELNKELHWEFDHYRVGR